MTWMHDQSDDPDVRCGDELDCDHHTGSATGIAAADGFAIMSSGWGTPGRVRRTQDGVRWDLVLELDFPFASIAGGPGGLMGATPRPWRSADGGSTWAEVPPVYLGPPLRQSLYIPEGNGRYLLTSESGELSVWFSDDQGDSFEEASPLPAGCLAMTLVYGAGVVVMQHVSGGVCRSSDGGQTWAAAAVGGGIGLQTLAFVGDRFVALGLSGALHESPDAQIWSETPTNLAADVWNLVLGHDSETESLVAVSGAYESQRFFRSDDGLGWTEVSGPQGHPIRRFISAALAAPACL